MKDQDVCRFALDTLKASTAALASIDESKYATIENTIASLTGQRDALAARIRNALNSAAFDTISARSLASSPCMSVARLRLAPVEETVFPPRSPFFQRPMLIGGTSRFPSAPSPAHRREASR
jgi:hypothetical protein